MSTPQSICHHLNEFRVSMFMSLFCFIPATLEQWVFSHITIFMSVIKSHL
jgi:hypothetical protein